MNELKNYIEYGIKALRDRKAYLANELSKATNPLDRLSIRDRMEEIDIAIGYFEGYNKFQDNKGE